MNKSKEKKGNQQTIDLCFRRQQDSSANQTTAPSPTSNGENEIAVAGTSNSIVENSCSELKNQHILSL